MWSYAFKLTSSRLNKRLTYGQGIQDSGCLFSFWVSSFKFPVALEGHPSLALLITGICRKQVEACAHLALDTHHCHEHPALKRMWVLTAIACTHDINTVFFNFNMIPTLGSSINRQPCDIYQHRALRVMEYGEHHLARTRAATNLFRK